MRLVTWNCKGAFHRKHHAVAELRPDLLVVPECEQLAVAPHCDGSPSVSSFHWVGPYPRKGLAVLGYGEYSCAVHPSYDPQHRWVVPISVTGPHSFILLAVWTVPHPDSGSYVQPLVDAFEVYKSLLEDSEAIWAGDFNAGFAFDRPSHRHKFRDFVSVLGRHGLRSVFHELHGCAHGEEPEHTYFHRHKAAEGFHLDYVFASKGFKPGSFSFSVGSHAEWSKLSDHMPLICDFAPPQEKGLRESAAGE